MSLTNALLLCGGNSTRMGSPKWLLNYHGMPQAYYLYHLLKPLVSHVFLSVRAEQQPATTPGYETLIDNAAFAHHGPISGLLTAFRYQPDANWLLLACDYPLLTVSTISLLLSSNTGPVAALSQPGSGQPEPLLAVYGVLAGPALQAWFQQGNDSLYRFLLNQNCPCITPQNPEELTNCNSPGEYETLKKRLAAG